MLGAPGRGASSCDALHLFLTEYKADMDAHAPKSLYTSSLLEGQGWYMPFQNKSFAKQIDGQTVDFIPAEACM